MKKIVAVLLFVSSGGAKVTAQTIDPAVSSYIETYKDIALQIGDSSHIPPAIILAQGILESGAGYSALTLKSNNHFGIKAYSDWNGPYVLHNDDKPHERFRKYGNAYDSYQDHAQFLTNKKRYQFLFSLDVCDYKAWARGLQKAGYATNKRYAQKLIDIIERYKLDEIDKPQNNVVTNDY